MAKLRILLCMVAVAMTAATPEDPISCNTNGTSPSRSDANELFKLVIDLGDSQCCQYNYEGDCTVLSHYGGSGVLICGKFDTCISAVGVTMYLYRVLNQCTRDVDGTKRVAGIYNIPDLLRIVIDTAPRVTNGIGTPIDTIAMKTDGNNV